MVLETTLESPLDRKDIQPVHPKGNKSWILIGRTDAEAETPTLWPPDAKNWLTWKDLDSGKDWIWEETGTTEDEMAGWHHQLSDLNLSKLRDLVMDREVWGVVVHRIWKSWTQLSNWTELKILITSLPWNKSWQTSLKDKYFPSGIWVQLHGICLYKSLTISFPQNLFLV